MLASNVVAMASKQRFNGDTGRHEHFANVAMRHSGRRRHRHADGRDQCGHADAREHAHHAAKTTQKQALAEEHAQNAATSHPESHCGANLPDPLDYRHGHGVRNAQQNDHGDNQLDALDLLGEELRGFVIKLCQLIPRHDFHSLVAQPGLQARHDAIGIRSLVQQHNPDMRAVTAQQSARSLDGDAQGSVVIRFGNRREKTAHGEFDCVGAARLRCWPEAPQCRLRLRPDCAPGPRPRSRICDRQPPDCCRTRFASRCQTLLPRRGSTPSPINDNVASPWLISPENDNRGATTLMVPALPASPSCGTSFGSRNA